MLLQFLILIDDINIFKSVYLFLNHCLASPICRCLVSMLLKIINLSILLGFFSHDVFSTSYNLIIYCFLLLLWNVYFQSLFFTYITFFLSRLDTTNPHCFTWGRKQIPRKKFRKNPKQICMSFCVVTPGPSSVSWTLCSPPWCWQPRSWVNGHGRWWSSWFSS